MGEGVAHIISPLSAPWCSWVMFGLLVCAALGEFFQPGIITQAPASLRVRIDRLYKASPDNFFGQTCINLFRLGTVAMLLCITFVGRFSFLTYLAVNGVILGVMGVKMLGNVLLDYTFTLSRRLGAMYEHYSNIATMVCLLLWPTVLILMHVGTPEACRWTMAVAAFLFLALWVYRSGAQYIRSLIAIPYMLLYWCTLEVLPLAALVYLSKITITTI